MIRNVPPQLISMRLRVFVGVGGVFGVPVITWSFTDSRGLGLGLAAGLFFGALTVSVAVWPEYVQRWGTRYPVLDALFGPLVLVFAFLSVFRDASLPEAALAAVVVWAVLTLTRLSVAPGCQRRLDGASGGCGEGVASPGIGPATSGQTLWESVWLLTIQAALVFAIVMVAVFLILGLVDLLA